jgi:hypothetical protein
LVAFFVNWSGFALGNDTQFTFQERHTLCPTCRQLIIQITRSDLSNPKLIRALDLVYPKGISRTPISPEVPLEFAQDYKEACLVLPDSAKASAALSRRCLQHLLRAKAGVKPSNLNREIQDLIESKQLPSTLSEPVDAIRNIGNFAAHPMKSTNTGEILEVEPGEAEWLLDILEGLFDFYFVQPALLNRKKDELNKKLASAGKPPMK